MKQYKKRKTLEEDMKSDKIVIDLLRDRHIAVTFYSALCNVRWIAKKNIPDDELIVEKLKGTDVIGWTCSWRYAGGIVADIRNEYHNTNENYMDFYCSGNEGIVDDLVRECFERMGWTQDLTY